MSYPQPPPATREINQKKLIDIIRIGHDTLEKEHQKLQDAVTAIIEFQLIPSEKEIKKVYQYEPENQHQYTKHEMTIASALSTFEPVINDSKNTLFTLEMQIPHDTSYDMPPPAQPIQTEGKSEGNENRSIWDKIRNTPKRTRIITEDDPYQDAIPFMRKTMSKMDRLLIFMEYQAYGINHSLTRSFPYMTSYLQIHRTRFRFDMAPEIIRVHKQWIEIIKAKEKMGAISFAMKLDDEIFKTRNDWMQQMQNKPK